ncbi:MAG: MoaF N-terminal domain-containing protein [Eubacteriales bacterium]|nr:MoaF N-terminal domain-containing protein [Eubacteriales bacterium]
MKERMERRWSQLTRQDVQMLADTTPVERYSRTGLSGGPYMPPFTEKLVGKEFTVRLDCGDSFRYHFSGIHALTWEKNAEGVHEEYAEALELPGEPDIYLVQYYCRKSVPPMAHTLVLDFRSGLATVCIARAGVLAEAPREIRREFFFGILEGYADTGARHGFTEELVGTAISWTYRDGVTIKHIYTAPKYYTYQMTDEAGRCWVASNPADYLKIREQVYVFSFLEERQAGTQGFFLINRANLHDVGAFFGIQAHGMECCMVGAKGTLAEPYAWEWCEGR